MEVSPRIFQFVLQYRIELCSPQTLSISRGFSPEESECTMSELNSMNGVEKGNIQQNILEELISNNEDHP